MRGRLEHPLTLALLALAVLVAAMLASHPGRVAAKTLLLLPDMFPTSPIRPLTWLTGTPGFDEYSFQFPAGQVDADVYLPPRPGRHGAVILLLGAVGYPRRDPTLVRFADGLARAGAVVMIPESSNLQQGDILPEETEGLQAAVDYLRSRPEVDPGRIGIIGFSVGGSLALLAAEAERGRETIAFVNAFGSYYDARELVVEVASETIEVGDELRRWEPSELTEWVFIRQLIAPLPDERDRDILTRAFVDKQPETQQEFDLLSPDGQLVLELTREPSPGRAREILRLLPPPLQARLAGISPSLGLDGLRSRVYLMHDRDDHYIPFVHSRQIRDALPPDRLGSYAEFDLFAHVLPDRPVEGAQFIGEVTRLYLHAWRLCQEFL
jgi:acetyl esterase/lipase